jgi:hypothetical protein
MTKKASFITMHCVQNYGSQLQAYATQEKLKSFFDEVEVIDFRRKDTYGKELSKLYTQGNPLKWALIKPTLVKWNKIFGDFQRRNLNLTKITYFNDEDFKANPIVCDALLVGSDQVWNTGWNKGIIEPYYLSFDHNTPKYSYASSFGKTKIEKSQIEKTRERLSNFKHISVREHSALTIVEKQLGLKAQRIIDPTLAFNADYWRRLKTKNTIKEEYILVYNLNRSRTFDNFAKKISAITNLPVYRFCTRYDQAFRYGKSLIMPDIFDFITYIDDARYVITDSFHATAFSANLHTEVIPIYPEKYSSRIGDFLELIQNERAQPKNFNDTSILNTKTNFEIVDKVLEIERKKTDRYLRMIVDEVKNG